jgi:hypothetical protein
MNSSVISNKDRFTLINKARVSKHTLTIDFLGDQAPICVKGGGL